MKKRKGTPDAPDVLELGARFARSAAQEGLLASYAVVPHRRIPDGQKDPRSRWFSSYGGYISIGCDAGRIAVCPISFSDLLKPEYRGKVALTGTDPRRSEVAFAAVYSAALANGGSFDDIQPGLDYFARLDGTGNLQHTSPNPAQEKIASGATPIVIEWDFLNLAHSDEIPSSSVRWKVSIPFDGSFSEYYAQAINKDAPHPAAARLWEEYVLSPEGQNLRLDDYARPALMQSMREDGTIDKAKAARLPTVEGVPTFPSEEQLKRSRSVVAKGWTAAVPGLTVDDRAGPFQAADG
ncbi:ABC transporter substrate-binding protein [Kitasatospora camelliae]|uniref:Extracellular solute-binding protein n=1 Tax=Kitasatospora camelliae TaxID=3156397 RepID=A0AAU8JRP1_9ACTN